MARREEGGDGEGRRRRRRRARRRQDGGRRTAAPSAPRARRELAARAPLLARGARFIARGASDACAHRQRLALSSALSIPPTSHRARARGALIACARARLFAAARSRARARHRAPSICAQRLQRAPRAMRASSYARAACSFLAMRRARRALPPVLASRARARRACVYLPYHVRRAAHAPQHRARARLISSRAATSHISCFSGITLPRARAAAHLCARSPLRRGA